MNAAGGFILVATLWVLAGLAVLAAYIQGVAEADVARAALAKQSFERELDRRSTEATLIYLLATGRMNHRALILEGEQRLADFLEDGEQLPVRGDGEIFVTGEVYAGLGETRFSIRDESGLAPANSPYTFLHRAALKRVGIPSPDATRIMRRIEDYIDTDSTARLNGAERFDYVQRGLPPPPNWLMASPLEIRKVLGLDDLIAPAQWLRLRPLLTMRQGVGLNFNTMHPELLAALIDGHEHAVQRLLDERARLPIRTLDQIAELTGRHLDIDPMDLRILPSDLLRISTWHPSGARWLAGIQLTPYVDGAPWRKDYQYTESVIDDDARTPEGDLRKPATALFQQPEHHPDG